MMKFHLFVSPDVVSLSCSAGKAIQTGNLQHDKKKNSEFASYCLILASKKKTLEDFGVCPPALTLEIKLKFTLYSWACGFCLQTDTMSICHIQYKMRCINLQPHVVFALEVKHLIYYFMSKSIISHVLEGSTWPF